MGMFDGQAADISLSDEALFGLAEDEAGEEALEERQETEQPQAEAETDSPAEEQTSEAAEAEAAEPDGEPAQEPEEQAKLSEQVKNLERQTQEATARMTRACQEAAELKRQNQQLNQMLQNLQQPAPPPTQSNEDYVQSFLQNPQAELKRLAQEQAAAMAGEKVKEVLRPVLESLEHKTRAEAWDKAWQEHSAAWAQMGHPQEQQQVIQRMAQISADMGDPELWQKQPARLLQMAAVELYGLPKAVNEDVIRAANEAGRKAALAEKQAKDASKAGLAAAKGASRSEPAALSPEEEIVSGIRAVCNRKML